MTKQEAGMAHRNHRPLEKAGRGKHDPEQYHAWLLGKGYSPRKAMEMVAKKFGQEEQAREASTGWAWRT